MVVLRNLIANGGLRKERLQKELPKLYASLPTNWTEYIYTLAYPDAGECVCGERTAFLNMKQGFGAYCSRACSNKSEATRAKAKKTLKRNYGVAHPMQSDKIHRKFKATMKKRHGVTYSGESVKLLNKSRATHKALYGSATPLQVEAAKAKSRSTSQLRYGTDNPMQSDKVQRKHRRTCLDRYGVSYTHQHRPILEKQQKSGFTIKTIRCKGRVFKCRGYEPAVIKHLVASGVDPKKVLTTSKEKIGSFKYKGTDGKQHVYHPDIRVGRNVIEVKSTYTAGLTYTKSGLFSMVRRKGRAVVRDGFKFTLAVVTVKGEVFLIKDAHLKTRKQVTAEVFPKV